MSSSASPATPATACSSPATGSPRRPRPSATTCPPCPTSRPRSARPPAPCRACRASSCTSPTTTSSRRATRPDVLVAMNPAALKANLADLPRGGDLIVNTDEFTERNLTKVGYDGQPARGRLARRVPGARHPADLDDGRGARRVRGHQEGGRAGEEHVRARPAVLAVRPPDRRHAEVPRGQVRASPRSRRPTSPRSRPAGTTARPPSRSRSATRSSRPRCSRAPTATSPATRRWPTA